MKIENAFLWKKETNYVFELIARFPDSWRFDIECYIIDISASTSWINDGINSITDFNCFAHEKRTKAIIEPLKIEIPQLDISSRVYRFLFVDLIILTLMMNLVITGWTNEIFEIIRLICWWLFCRSMACSFLKHQNRNDLVIRLRFIFRYSINPALMLFFLSLWKYHLRTSSSLQLKFLCSFWSRVSAIDDVRVSLANFD